MIYESSLSNPEKILRKSRITDYYLVKIIEHRRGDYGETLREASNPLYR